MLVGLRRGGLSSPPPSLPEREDERPDFDPPPLLFELEPEPEPDEDEEEDERRCFDDESPREEPLLDERWEEEEEDDEEEGRFDDERSRSPEREEPEEEDEDEELRLPEESDDEPWDPRGGLRRTELLPRREDEEEDELELGGALTEVSQWGQIDQRGSTGRPQERQGSLSLLWHSGQRNQLISVGYSQRGQEVSDSRRNLSSAARISNSRSRTSVRNSGGRRIE